MEAQGGNPRAVRLLALLELLYGSGLRATELVSLPLAAVPRDAPRAVVRGADRPGHLRLRLCRRRPGRDLVATCPAPRSVASRGEGLGDRRCGGETGNAGCGENVWE